MSEPSDDLRQLAAQGRQILAKQIAAVRARRTAPARVAAGVDVLDYLVDLTGYKRTARGIGRLLAEDSAHAQDAGIESEYEHWAQSVRGTLGETTLIGKRVPSQPNSAVLLKRFGATQSFVRLSSKISRGVAFLESLAEARVVHNANLEALRVPRHPPPPRSAPDQQLSGALLLQAEGAEVRRLLVGFPEEQKCIEGALTVFQAGTPDSGRQAMNSCRACVENLVKRLSGEGQWSEGLTKILPSDTRRQPVRHAYSFLSAYGTHGLAEPSVEDTEMGLRLTFVAVRSILGGSHKPG